MNYRWATPIVFASILCPVTRAQSVFSYQAAAPQSSGYDGSGLPAVQSFLVETVVTIDSYATVAQPSPGQFLFKTNMPALVISGNNRRYKSMRNHPGWLATNVFAGFVVTAN